MHPPKRFKVVSEVMPGQIIDRLEPSLGNYDLTDDIGPSSFESAEVFEAVPYPLLPTIGMEIELPHTQLDRRLQPYIGRGRRYVDLSEDQKTETGAIFNDIDKRWKPILKAIGKTSIQIGKDSYAELIFPPYYYHGSLADISDYLFGVGVIPEGRYPLHITLGNINLLENPLEAQLLARGVELLEGSDDFRIRGPVVDDKPQWTQKTESGFLIRGTNETAGNVWGLELRALVARNAGQLRRVLWRTQWLGACLNGWLNSSEEERQNPELIPSEELGRQFLTQDWNGFSAYMKQLYELNGLSLDALWEGGPDSEPQWYKHSIMCGDTLGNIPQRKVLHEVMDSFLTSAEACVLTHHRMDYLRQKYGVK